MKKTAILLLAGFALTTFLSASPRKFMRQSAAPPSPAATPNPNCPPDSLCPDWVTRYDGGALHDRAVGAVTSPDGSRLYVTGASTSTSSNLDFATVAYNTTNGTQLWISRYNGPANGADQPFYFGTGKQIAISADGKTIFVIGLSARLSGQNDYVTIAYRASDGAQLWVSRYSTPNDSIAASVALSGDGRRVYVTGYSALGPAVPPAPPVDNYDFTTIAYDTATGDQIWLARYDGPAGFWDIPYDIAVANVRQPNGTRHEEVFVTGRSNGASSGNNDADFATVAYDGLTGSQLWVTRYNGPGNGRDLAYAAAASPDGSLVCVTGESATSTADYATVCYDTVTGAQRWVSRYDNGDLDEPLGIAFSPTGDRVAVTGFSGDPPVGIPLRSAATIVYDAATGAQVWLARHTETDGAAAVRVAFSHDGRRLYAAGLENGNVFVVGPAQAGHAPAITLAYDASNGTELWATHYSGPAGDEGGYGLVVSPDDTHIYVTGGGQSDAADFATLSYPALATAGAGLTSDWVSPLGLTPTARSDAAMVYDAARQQIVLFGGASGGGGLAGLNNETWLLRSGSWTQAGPQHLPLGRQNPGITYDGARQQVVLFGGYTASSIRFGDSNDTWIWNGNDWAQAATSASPNSLPKVREAPAMAYYPDAGLTILFGGYSSDGVQTSVLNDTWTWNGSAWSQLSPATSPSARYGATLVHDAARHKLLLFGGFGLNDTWTWDGTTWKQENPTTRPSIRSYAAATYDVDLNVVLLHGGLDASGNALNDTWTWDGANWTQQSPLHTPGARGDAVFAYDANQHRAFLFGGANATTAFGDTWAWDGADWISLGQATQPSPRQSAPMAYDPRQNNTILFGGLWTFGVLNDTWKWNGSSWTQLHPAAEPPLRGYTPLVDDPEVGRLLVFGGFGAGSVLNDTWSWDGSTWIHEQPATSPSARTSPQLAFDGNHLLLYGGYDGHGTVFGDTWSWNGVNWTQLTPATSPPPLNAGAMTYDPVHHQVVLFGGSTGGGIGVVVSANVGVPLDQTWTWDGSNWTQQHPAHSPPAIAYQSMIFDANLGGVVLFNGGQAAPGPETTGPKGFYNNELWFWDGTDWTQVFTPTVPGPRGLESLTYDSARRALVLYGGVGAHGLQGDTWTFAPAPAQLLAVKSRKVHGSAGTFDLDFPLNGNPAIECRSGGANGDYKIVFTFANALTSVANASISAGTASITSRGIGDDAHDYVVDLTGVANAQTITVSLSNVYDSAGNRSGTVQGTMAVLIGDVNANGTVSNADVSSIQAQVGATVTQSNFRNDVNANGTISNGDVAPTQAQVGRRLPP
jgi:hypothetical protein